MNNNYLLKKEYNDDVRVANRGGARISDKL